MNLKKIIGIFFAKFCKSGAKLDMPRSEISFPFHCQNDSSKNSLKFYYSLLFYYHYKVYLFIQINFLQKKMIFNDFCAIFTHTMRSTEVISEGRQHC